MTSCAEETIHHQCARMLSRLVLLAGLALAFAATETASVRAADQIKVGKASATTFAFAPIEIGKERGVWAKYNLDVESIGFGGDARLQQAMVANSIDFALGSGPGMGFISKGVPSITGFGRAKGQCGGENSRPPMRDAKAAQHIRRAATAPLDR